jgi:uncharacterized protein
MNVSLKKSNPGLTDEEISEMSEVFKRFPSIEKVILFGSRAMGNHKPGSDVDLALMGKVNEDTLFQVHEALEEETLLPYFFDVIAYEEINNPALKEHIDDYGKAIYKKD